MTVDHSTASTAVSKSTTYPILVPNPNRYRVAEDGEDYETFPFNTDSFAWEIKRAQLQAGRSAADGQIMRLYALANLLLEPAPADRPAEELATYAKEIRHAAGKLEEFLYYMVDPLINDPEPEDDNADND